MRQSEVLGPQAPRSSPHECWPWKFWAACGLILLLACRLMADPPTITLPAAQYPLTGDRLPNQLTVGVTGADKVSYRFFGKSVKGFREYDPDQTKLLFQLIGYADGESYLSIVAWNKDGAAQAVLIIPVTGPSPPPVPPGPTPGPGPGPTPGPGPLPGAKALILFDEAKATALPSGQKQVIYGQDVRTYLNAHTDMGPDGKTHDWRIWPADTDPSAEAQVWQDALKRPRTALPWLIVSGPGGSYEGPVPPDVPQALAILKKCLEK